MNDNTLSKSDCSKIKEMILKGEIDINLMSERDLNVFIDYLLNTFNPDEETDTILLEQCYIALDSYTDADNLLSTEEYVSMVCNTLSTFNYTPKKSTKKRVVFLIAAIITAIILTGCSLAGLIAFNVIDLGKDLLNLKENEKVSQDNIDIIRTDNCTLYNTIEELIRYEELPSIYPSELPDEYKLQNIKVLTINNLRRVYISYSTQNGNNINITIIENKTTAEHGELFQVNGLNIFITSIDSSVQAEWTYNGNLYNIKCSDSKLLYKLLNSLKEH